MKLVMPKDWRYIGKELDGRSREFYEFVMPAIDIIEEGNDLVVTIDLPGFAKKDINLRIIHNVLYITAKREQVEVLGTACTTDTGRSR
jgi:HSP20 family protein